MSKVSGHSLKPETNAKPVMRGGCAPDPGSLKKNAGAGDDATGWALEPHVCRHCFSRLVSKTDGSGVVQARCPNCDAVSAGGVDSLCACGIRLRRDGPAGTRLVDAGIRCKPNPSPSPEFPSLFVAIAG